MKIVEVPWKAQETAVVVWGEARVFSMILKSYPNTTGKRRRKDVTKSFFKLFFLIKNYINTRKKIKSLIHSINIEIKY